MSGCNDGVSGGRVGGCMICGGGGGRQIYRLRVWTS